MILQFKTRRPGTHIIIRDGWEIGRIQGETGQGWEVQERCAYDRWSPVWDIGMHIFPTLKDAKRYVVQNIKKRYFK